MVELEHDEPGVYELGDARGAVVYIGSSDQLRRRLKEHLGEAPFSCLRRHAMQYRVEHTATYAARERELLAQHQHLHGHAPLCNNSGA